MKPFARKEYLTLPKPSADDPLDDRARLLRALGPETVHMTLAAMQALYPALRADDYRVTATLSPAEHGWTMVRVEPGDTTARFFALALDIGTTTLEMELLHLPDGEALSARAASTGSAHSETTSSTAFSTPRTTRRICTSCKHCCSAASAV